MSDHDAFFDDVLASHIALARRVGDEMRGEVASAARVLADAIRSGHKVLVCGNGGSAADAQHFAAELVGRFGRDGTPLPAIALTVDTSILTAIGNDRSFDDVFAVQVEAIGENGDALVAITTSGRSPNVLAAVESARDRGMAVVALSGEGGRATLGDAEAALCVPSGDTQRIQEMHSMLLHVVGEIVVEEAG